MHFNPGHPVENTPSYGNPGTRNSTQFYDWGPDYRHIPLIVPYTGRTIWGPDNYWKRVRNQLFSVELVTEGSIVFIQDDREHLVEKGMIFLVHRGKNNYYRTGPAGFVHKRFVTMDGSLLDSLLDSTGLYQCDTVKPGNWLTVLNLCKQAGRILEERRHGFALRLSETAYALILELADSMTAPLVSEPVRTVMHFLQCNTHRAVDMDEMAQVANLSSPHLNRLFRYHVKQSPGAYFIRQKMIRAMQLFAMTSVSVTQAAQALGYQSPFSFSRQFKNITGLSPREYRKRQRETG